MFDIGFWELMLVGVIALLVVGPERLPGLARTAGIWIGRMRYFVNNVKADINRELKADELKRILEEQARIPELNDLVNETRWSFNEAESSGSTETWTSKESNTNKISSASDALDYHPDDFLDAVEISKPTDPAAPEPKTNESTQ